MESKPQQIDLNGKVALITGAGSGIGEAIAKAFAGAGARIALAGRTVGKLEVVAATLPSGSAKAIPLQHEVESEVERGVEQAVNHFGAIDILVNNAGGYVPGRVAETPLSAWNKALALNLTGPALMTRAALPHLRRRPGSSIVNIASTLGIQPLAGTAPYSVAKAGLVQLTRIAALEEAAAGVRVNCICPGVVDTPIHRQRVGDREGALEEYMAAMRSSHPLGRVGEPAEIAACALFLASSLSAWTTGSVVCVDGGISLT
jgi:NAD(P)-dependent dehydrogenase (short-subunit alcohol dehydrogenase family)